MKNCKLISLDLDGTLLNSKKGINENTKNALMKAQEQGATVILNSGRQLPGLLESSEILQLSNNNGFLSSYNGGKVVNAKTNEILFEEKIPNKLAIEILRHLENFPATPLVDDGKYVYTTEPENSTVKAEAANNNLTLKQVENIADVLSFDPFKILVYAPNEILTKYDKEIVKPFVDQVASAYSAPVYFEIMMKGISKANSLKILCEKLNISPDEIIAFGDAGNDIEMLKFAGLGVAMGNASNEVKKIADEVTLTNDEDGIVHILKRYFDID